MDFEAQAVVFHQIQIQKVRIWSISYWKPLTKTVS